MSTKKPIFTKLMAKFVERGYNQAEAAAVIGLSHQTMNNYLRAKVPFPVHICAELMREFEIPSQDYFEFFVGPYLSIWNADFVETKNKEATM